MPKITRAIVSVTDKTGVVDFCKGLVAMGVQLLSTGGTAKVLRDNGLVVEDVSHYTGSPEVLDGRLKTLHPKIEGGILGIRNNPQHVKEMADLGILPIDLVVVNLYDFEKVASKMHIDLADGDGHPTIQEMIEQIDIGGPTMLRAAAKNYDDVTVVVDPADYPAILSEMQKNGGAVSVRTNLQLAIKVFQTTTHYDSRIASSMAYLLEPPMPFPKTLAFNFEKIQDLRYGENPHQRAAYYGQKFSQPGSVTSAKQLHGKELSYNNILDADAALQCVAEFYDPACVIVKHTNPCGAALGKTLSEAFVRARDGDPVSSFGGIIAINRRMDLATAKAIGETFFECIVAPGYDEEALAILKSKKNIRLLNLEAMPTPQFFNYQYRQISGGLLVQEGDVTTVDLKACPVPTKRKPNDAEYAELDFAWKLVKHVKSNAIIYTKNRQLLGVGAGQMSRVDSVKIAGMKSKQSLEGAVMASDAFFPFRDGVDEAATQKISAIVQPGGSIKDPEVIKAADEHGLAMVMTGVRHFKH